MKNDTVIYRIRNKTTGLYSKGGIPPTFGETGKCYVGLSILRQYLKQVTTVLCNQVRQDDNVVNPYKDCEVIAYTENGQTANHELEQVDIDVFAFRMRKK
jgi:hypothetical protein